MRADGSSRRRVTSGGRSFHPVWSPDGRRIYFARAAAGRPSTVSIWSMRPDGSDQRAVTARVPGRYDIPGSFAPDGAALAFTREREIWVMRPDGSEARKLAARSRDPVFSPDGRRIAFVCDRDENGSLSYGDRTFFANELYVMDADGSRPRRLTRTRAENELQPAWLPGGARIAYQRGRGFQNAEATVVMQANVDGSGSRLVFPNPGSDAWPWHAAPAWRPGRP
jgi:Tol biopolymer transport system component